MVISWPKMPYMHRMYTALANPKYLYKQPIAATVSTIIKLQAHAPI
jgi:hypothetical protein